MGMKESSAGVWELRWAVRGLTSLGRDIAPLSARIATSPEIYGKIAITEFAGGDQEIARPSSADFVLTFRNIHNWMRAGTAEAAFRAFYRALKPGGILGVEEHRARPD